MADVLTLVHNVFMKTSRKLLLRKGDWSDVNNVEDQHDNLCVSEMIKVHADSIG